MSYATIIEKINLLPEDQLNEAENLIENLLLKIKSDTKNKSNLNKDIKEKRKLGIADGKYAIPENIDILNDEIAKLFGVE
ncbi:MAG: hypothetical protein II961_06995 [Candidatus Riflebacteria bacterium]|nr:hypothetical protein [Candidatus Riflebacteria bacterium]